MKFQTDTIMKQAYSYILQKEIDLKELYVDELYTHSINVAKLSVQLGLQLNVNMQELLDLAIGGLLHDYGKAFIEAKILYKPEKLNNMEYYLIQNHPSRGYKELKHWGFNKNVLMIILNHHEKLSGTGYPIGKENIPFLVQIVTVADMYDAIYSKRSYHQKRTKEEAFSILSQEKGINPIVVDALEKILNLKHKEKSA